MTVENERWDHTLFISCQIHNDIFQNLQNTLTEEGCILHIRLHERIRYHVEAAGDGGWNGLVLCDRDQYIVVIQLEGEEKREKRTVERTVTALRRTARTLSIARSAID